MNDTTNGGCPVDHAALLDPPRRRTRLLSKLHSGPPIVRDEKGVWHVYGYAEARAILRGDATIQAGFGAERIESATIMKNKPILYQEGEAHRTQRSQTAKFFTPTTVKKQYQEMMDRFSEGLILELQRHKTGHLDEMSLQLAVKVAAEVVGLTNSVLPGMAARLDHFFSGENINEDVKPPLWKQVTGQFGLLKFFALDVLPAIWSRRKNPKEDVISHVIGKGYSNLEILTECLTYAAAGMATTREFIVVVAWHLLEHDALRERYLVAGEPERYAILHELLRLEPVIASLYRRAKLPITIPVNGSDVVIEAGSLIEFHVYESNADERSVPETPHEACPGRTLEAGVPEPVLSFGDGHHRCPGAYVAIQETDIFLRKLLAVPGLRLTRAPDVTFNATVQGYELRGCQIECA
jgi:cytochrome P450